MSFDTALAIFSPDGRLLQVERAQLASEQGALVVFSKQSDHISVAFEKRTSNKMLIDEDINKLVLIDPVQNIFMSFSGFSPDFNVIADHARWICRNYKYFADENINIEQLARKLAYYKQKNTIEGGKRPFGVRTLVFGFHEQFRVFMVEPDGNYSEYDRGAIGNKNKIVIEHFEKTEPHENDALEGAFLVVQNDINKICGFKIKQDGVERVGRDHITQYMQELSDKTSKQ